MLQAQLVDVIKYREGNKKKCQKYFTLKDINTGEVGTYSEQSVYMAIRNRQIKVDHLSVGRNINQVIVSTTFIFNKLGKDEIKDIKIVSINKLKEEDDTNKSEDDTEELEDNTKKLKVKSKKGRIGTNKNKLKALQCYVSPEKEPRLIEIDNQILDIDRQISVKNTRLKELGIKIKCCENMTEVSKIEDIGNIVERDLENLIRKRNKLVDEKEAERLRIEQEKKHKEKKLNACKKIVAKSEYSIDEYEQIIHDLELEIAELENEISNTKSKAKIDTMRKKIYNLNKKIKTFEGYRDTLSIAIKVIRELSDDND